MTRDINNSPYPELIADHRNRVTVWLETNAETYLDQLGALPPAQRNRGAFMVGEPFTYDETGTIHAAFVFFAGRYFCKFAPLESFDADRYCVEICKQFDIQAGKDGVLWIEKRKFWTPKNSHETSFHATLKNPWSTEIYKAVVIPGDSIWLTGTYFNMTKPFQYDITFKLGDPAEYDSYNLRYIGKIVSITEKTVTIEHGHGQKERTRLTLARFASKNYDFNLERIQAENAIESQCI